VSTSSVFVLRWRRVYYQPVPGLEIHRRDLADYFSSFGWIQGSQGNHMRIIAIYDEPKLLTTSNFQQDHVISLFTVSGSFLINFSQYLFLKADFPAERSDVYPAVFIDTFF